MSTFNMSELDGVKAHTGTRVTPDAGDYTVLISKSTVENGKTNGAMNAAMEYTIVSEGQFTGAVVKEWLAIVNKSEQAQNIARGKLRAIQVVSKSQNVSAIDDLTGKTILIRINKEPNQYVDNNGNTRNGFQNNVVNYMDLKRNDADGKEVPAFVAGPQVQQVTQQASFQRSTGTSQTTSRSDNKDEEIPF